MIAALLLIASTGLTADLRVGQQSPAFEFESEDGLGNIKFPASYTGKIILLDFWGVWCAPCRAEIPNVRKAYSDHHANGFEVLGAAMQHSDDQQILVKPFARKNQMPWPQINGRAIERLYGVTSIPFVLLVDGDSGKILATTNQLRGPGLSNFIGRALAKKRQTPNPR